MNKRLFSCAILAGLISCQSNNKEIILSESVDSQLENNNQRMIEAAKTKSFDRIADLYDEESLLMAEYNPLIHTAQGIATYYDSIYSRENIREYSRQTLEVLTLGTRVIEVGLFNKSLTDSSIFRGKYMNVWKVNPDGQLRLRAESFGYLHPIEDPSPLLVPEASVPEPTIIDIPRELEAYNALDETNVIDRIPARSANSYTEDGMYLPFADTIKSGRANLLKHYTAYYEYPVKIDSIQEVTYAYDKLEDGYIRYTGFYVSWIVPGFSGNTTGTGISYWRRGEDNSLRIHRQIGLHIHRE